MTTLPDIPRPMGGRPPKYPLHSLEVGEHFDLPLSGEQSPHGGDKQAYKVSGAAVAHAKKYGKKFVVRTLRPEGIVRCWRIA